MLVEGAGLRLVWHAGKDSEGTAPDTVLAAAAHILAHAAP